MQPKANNLTRNQRNILQTRRHHERDKRFYDRTKTILLLDKGWTYKPKAEALLLDDDTIRRYYKTNLEGGKEALLNLNDTGKVSRLNQEQLDQLKIYVSKAIPSSAEQVTNFIKKRFSIPYTVSAIGSLLHRLHFEYKKPKLVPGKAKAEEQACFLKEHKTLEKDIGESNEIIYIDAVHLQHHAKPSYGRFKKGVKALLKANNGRQRINMNGRINTNTLEVTTMVADSIHAKSTIEQLWLFMNTKMRNHQYDETFVECKKATLGFFENISSYQKELKGFLSKKFHIVNS
ncbi:MAG: winged helix-turn-helix domain-containing protein [Chlamydiales bacterium]|jgi:transposase|nr:winged helix-turn-helix domain-containing protein [Chlamydiales bacterium]